MSNRVPFVATALAAAVLCFMLCVTIRRAGAQAPLPRIQCRSCLRSSTTAAMLAAKNVADAQDVVGRDMPALHFDRWLNTPDGKPLNTAGKVVLYRWWTDGCPHCEKTLPAVERLRKEYAPRGLQVVAVYHPKPPREVSDKSVMEAAKEYGYDGAVALDLDWSELNRFYLSTGERKATSASFLVDRAGVIRFAHPGPRFFPSEDPAEAKEDADYRAIVDAIESLVGKAQ
jgi:thiol-disulfide isomerase/thioredoxin